MSCILTIIGEDLNPDGLIEAIDLTVHKVTKRGEQRFKTQPDRGLMPYTVVSYLASDAGLDNVEQQIIDAETYLVSNFEKLNLISQIAEVQYATLRFGVRHYVDKFGNDVYFPPSLMKLVGALGLSIELSSYTAEREIEEQ